jgi:hypothetical protein
MEGLARIDQITLAHIALKGPHLFTFVHLGSPYLERETQVH